MSHPVVERRRTPRAQPTDEPSVMVDASLPVQVLEMSRSGVLLESKAEMRVGDRAELSVTVSGRSLSLGIEVRHVSVGPSRHRGLVYKAGAALVLASAEERSVLEQLLGPERT